MGSELKIAQGISRRRKNFASMFLTCFCMFKPFSGMFLRVSDISKRILA